MEMSETYQTDDMFVQSPHNESILEDKEKMLAEDCIQNHHQDSEHAAKNITIDTEATQDNRKQSQNDRVIETTVPLSRETSVLAHMKITSIKIILVILAIFLTGMVALILCHWSGQVSYCMFMFFFFIGLLVCLLF